jgi:LytS/YehU family sensor histidine kinase
LLTASVLAYRWRIAAVKKQQSMKSIQLESELNFLKSQVNPHFLFNTLNNIYALCQVNSRNAAPMVGKVSDMMRYMIYDCNADLVPLQKEIEYLQNYIDLHLLKSHRKLNVVMAVQGQVNGLKIAPLLLINFLENCFKHGDLTVSGQGFIHVELVISGTALLLTMRNSFREKTSAGIDRRGIGLDNVKHRLTLLYPSRHKLRIEKNNGIFEVELKLHLD